MKVIKMAKVEKMAKIMDKGRVCIIKTGRDFGRLCLVLKNIDNNFMEVEGPKLKKTKMNILHLWPLDEVAKDVKELSKLKL
jgi:ribosomal protein L14E/L6E/L27E